MRILLKIKSGGQPVPFNNQQNLTGTIHKWLGQNPFHGKLSLYCFSWLIGGRKKGDHLVFSQEAYLAFNSYDITLLKLLIRGIQKDPHINFGLQVNEILIQETPQFESHQVFQPYSPILVKRRKGDQEIHYTYDNPESDIFLTETLKTKLSSVGLSSDNVQVNFQRDHPSAKTKIIYYKTIGNRVNLCPVKITGSPEQIAFAWDVGIGNCTGIGFGSLK